MTAKKPGADGTPSKQSAKSVSLSDFSRETLEALLDKPELLDAEIGRRSFLQFCLEVGDLPTPPSRHHLLLIDKLQQVADGKIDRLAVAMPPGHAKSFYCSVMFPAYLLGRNKKCQMICASSTTDFAASNWGREIRNLIQTRKYQDLFGVNIARDSNAAGLWRTDRGGKCYCCGVGAQTQGHRSHYVVADDLYASREMAHSERERKRIQEFFFTDLQSRLFPNGAMVLIHTRWRDDDLIGIILAGQAEGLYADWEVISLPAICEDADSDPLGRKVGEALWPEVYTVEYLQRIKANLGTPGDWSALYQQRPSPEEGDVFKATDIRYYQTLPDPERLYYYAASDFAASASKRADHTVHMVVAVDDDSNLYVVDVWRDHADTERSVETLLELQERYEPALWFCENGVIQKSIEPFLFKRMHETGTYVNWRVLPVSRGPGRQYSKAQRAYAIQARAAQGKLWLPERALFAPQLVSELLAFPNSKEDDQVDCLALFGRYIHRLKGRRILPEEQPEPSKPVSKWTFNDLHAHLDKSRPESAGRAGLGWR